MQDCNPLMNDEIEAAQNRSGPAAVQHIPALISQQEIKGVQLALIRRASGRKQGPSSGDTLQLRCMMTMMRIWMLMRQSLELPDYHNLS